jgi:hypothetical protein
MHPHYGVSLFIHSLASLCVSLCLAVCLSQVEVEVEVEVIQYVNQIVEKEVEEYVDVPIGRVVYNDKVVVEEVMNHDSLSLAHALALCAPLSLHTQKQTLLTGRRPKCDYRP